MDKLICQKPAQICFYVFRAFRMYIYLQNELSRMQMKPTFVPALLGLSHCQDLPECIYDAFPNLNNTEHSLRTIFPQYLKTSQIRISNKWNTIQSRALTRLGQLVKNCPISQIFWPLDKHIMCLSSILFFSSFGQQTKKFCS